MIWLLSFLHNMSNFQANASRNFDIGIFLPLFCPCLLWIYSRPAWFSDRDLQSFLVWWGISCLLNCLGQQRTRSLVSFIWTRAHLSQTGESSGAGGTWSWVPLYYPQEYTNLPLNECHAIDIWATDNSLPRGKPGLLMDFGMSSGHIQDLYILGSRFSSVQYSQSVQQWYTYFLD